MAVSLHDGSFPLKLTFSPPILLQRCNSSSLLVFFPTKLILIYRFFNFYFSLTNHTMSTTSFCKTITIHLKRKEIWLIYNNFSHMGSWGILGRKKTCKHSLLHIQKVIQTSYLKENSQILTQLKTKKKSQHPCFSFLNTRWGNSRGRDSSCFTQRFRFRWRNLRKKKKRSETGWTNAHAQPFRHHW